MDGNRLSVTVDHADGALTVTALFWCHSFRLVMGEHHVLRVSGSAFPLLLTQLSSMRRCPATQASSVRSKGRDSDPVTTGPNLNSPLSYGKWRNVLKFFAKSPVEPWWEALLVCGEWCCILSAFWNRSSHCFSDAWTNFSDLCPVGSTHETHDPQNGGRRKRKRRRRSLCLLICLFWSVVWFSLLAKVNMPKWSVCVCVAPAYISCYFISLQKNFLCLQILWNLLWFDFVNSADFRPHGEKAAGLLCIVVYTELGH